MIFVPIIYIRELGIDVIIGDILGADDGNIETIYIYTLLSVNWRDDNHMRQ